MSSNFTEDERTALFEKLEKISKLFGLEIEVREYHTHPNNSCAVIGQEKIELGKNINNQTKLFEDTFDNIDNYTKNLPIHEFKSIPYIILSYMHELAHLLTMNQDDVVIYNKHINRAGWWISDEDYRKLPYEKLADNLGYQLLSDNYKQIMSVLMGKRIRIDHRRVTKNIITSRKFKEHYVTE